MRRVDGPLPERNKRGEYKPHMGPDPDAPGQLRTRVEKMRGARMSALQQQTSSNTENQREGLRTLSTRVVTTPEEFNLALKMLKEIFTDPTDLETDERFREFYNNKKIARYYLLYDGDVCVGASLVRLNPNVPDAMYVPYAGILEEHRGKYALSEMPRITREHMNELGVKKALIDAEDPARIRGVYPGDQDEVVRYTEKRLHFFQRGLGMYFVDDPILLYHRPISGRQKNKDRWWKVKSKVKLNVQSYDLLGVYPADLSDPYWNGVFNEDMTEMSVEAYADDYLKIMQIEYGDEFHAPSKEALCNRHPAIKLYFDQIAAHPEQKSVKIRPGTKP